MMQENILEYMVLFSDIVLHKKHNLKMCGYNTHHTRNSESCTDNSYAMYTSGRAQGHIQRLTGMEGRGKQCM